MSAAASLVLTLPAGVLADHVGYRRAYLIAQSMGVLGLATLIGVSWLALAYTGAVLIGLARAVGIVSGSALLGNAAAGNTRGHAFTLRHSALNLGFGIGALVSGMLFDVDKPASFIWVLALDAASYAVAALIVLRRVKERAIDQVGRPSRIWSTLANRQVLAIIVYASAFFLFTDAVVDVMVPAVGVEVLGLPEAAVGGAYALSTITVVATALTLPRFRPLRWSTRARLGAGCCSAAWGALLVAQVSSARLLWYLTMAVTYAVGETLVVPALAGRLNEIAPAQHRARYNAAYGMALSAPAALGPSMVGAALAFPPHLYLGALSAGCAALAVATVKLDGAPPRYWFSRHRDACADEG